MMLTPDCAIAFFENETALTPDCAIAFFENETVLRIDYFRQQYPRLPQIR